MLTNFLNASSGKGEVGGGGVIQTGNGLNLLVKMASEGAEYSVQGFAGHAPNSLLVNNAPALNSLIGFINFATDTVKWLI